MSGPSYLPSLVSSGSAFEVGTTLYPHQKKALTFLLEREREKPGSDGKFSSLWQVRMNQLSGATMWYHIVTQKEVSVEPPDCRGAILADDVRSFSFFSPPAYREFRQYVDGPWEDHHMCSPYCCHS